MREALQPSGVDITQYSGHSFRIGAATTAAVVGIEDSLIRTLGRWESAAYLLYGGCHVTSLLDCPGICQGVLVVTFRVVTMTVPELHSAILACWTSCNHA